MYSEEAKYAKKHQTSPDFLTSFALFAVRMALKYQIICRLDLLPCYSTSHLPTNSFREKSGWDGGMKKKTWDLWFLVLMPHAEGMPAFSQCLSAAIPPETKFKTSRTLIRVPANSKYLWSYKQINGGGSSLAPSRVRFIRHSIAGSMAGLNHRLQVRMLKASQSNSRCQHFTIWKKLRTQQYRIFVGNRDSIIPRGFSVTIIYYFRLHFQRRKITVAHTSGSERHKYKRYNKLYMGKSGQCSGA